jgi:hypothetical protein
VRRRKIKRLKRAYPALTPMEMMLWSAVQAGVTPGSQVYVYRPPKSGRKALRSFTVEITTAIEPLP